MCLDAHSGSQSGKGKEHPTKPFHLARRAFPRQATFKSNMMLAPNIFKRATQYTDIWALTLSKAVFINQIVNRLCRQVVWDSLSFGQYGKLNVAPEPK